MRKGIKQFRIDILDFMYIKGETHENRIYIGYPIGA